MFERIKWEFQCLKGKDKNSNLQKDRVGIPVFKRTRLKFQCLKG